MKLLREKQGVQNIKLHFVLTLSALTAWQFSASKGCFNRTAKRNELYTAMLFVNLLFLLGTSDPEANSGQMLTEQCGPQRQIPYMK